MVSAAGEFRGGHSTLQKLRVLPTPLDSIHSGGVSSWANLYDDLAATQRKLWQAKARGGILKADVDTTSLDSRIEELEREANTAVSQLIGLTDEEQVLMHDLVHVRRRLADGLVPTEVVRKPEKKEIENYARRLERTLDRAIEESEPRRHHVAVVADGASGMVRIELGPTERGEPRRPVSDASEAVANEFAKIRTRMQRERGQWLYFDRNLFLFDGPRTYILKPLQRLWWTESQALADADHLVAEAIAPAEIDVG
jgi:regulator of replication initiation timing